MTTTGQTHRPWITTTSATTTTVPATIQYTTTTPYTTTTSYTTSTITEPYPSCHPGMAGPGCATTTTFPEIFGNNGEDDACYRYPLGREHFITRVMEAISTAAYNDKLTLSHNGRDTIGSAMRLDQFINWLRGVFELFYEDITEESPRKCLAEKFKDSVEQGETGASNFLTHDELGSDCALDIEDGDIDNACQKLDTFFVLAYEDCRTEGSQVLSKLRFRCDRINEIREEIADRDFYTGETIIYTG